LTGNAVAIVVQVIGIRRVLSKVGLSRGLILKVVAVMKIAGVDLGGSSAIAASLPCEEHDSAGDQREEQCLCHLVLPGDSVTP
jgi:hypothetical protein